MSQMTIQQALELAVNHHNANRLPEAEALYRQILAVNPNQSDAMHLLGVIAFQMNHLDAARELIARAIAIHPNDENYHYNLGHVLAVAGDRNAAIESYRRAIAIRPDHAEAYNNMGIMLAETRQHASAIEAYNRALAINPNFADCYCNLSNALRETNQIEAALAAALKGRELRPTLPAGHNNLGAALLRSGRFDEAIESYRRAIELDPNFAMAHYNLAMALLMTGKMLEAWPHAEWRWKAKELDLYVQNFPQPMWDGSNLNGKTILLHSEQGFGDAIHLVRYVPDVIKRGGKVLLAIPKDITRLMQSVEGVEAIITDGDPVPQFDVHCPMLSLPMVFQTSLETIPAPIPYLHAKPQLIKRWQERLGTEPDVRRIGLVWAGRPEHKNDHNRSIPLILLAPLAAVPNVHFFSLQKGRAAEQVKSPPPGIHITDLNPELHDFTDSAAVLENLDLLITVDTAPAHLAGALGRPVWMLLPYTPDWRWMLDREDSPWYPTMRLFRQPVAGDWKTPVDRLTQALSLFCAEKAKL